MSHDVLLELVIVFALALAAAYASRRVRVPAIVGFMIAGVIAGPGGLGLVAERGRIEMLAEIGVVLLLFGVGLHISTRDLWAMRRVVFGAGVLQVVITAIASAAMLAFFETSWVRALLVGVIVALSSTALVVRLLEERGETDAAHGRFTLGVLIGQDLCVVPVFFALPLLAGDAGSPWDLAKSALGAAAVIAAAGLAARVIFPWLAARVIRVRSPELFTLLTAVAVFGTALAVGHAGASAALGAFLAGVVVSDSEYSQQIVAEIAPFREVFNSLFFVSLGMLASPAAWIEAPFELGTILIVLVTLKALVVFGIGLVSLRSTRPALIAAAALAQVGEFSFVVAFEATARGLLDEPRLMTLLAAAVPTMILTPFLIALASRVRASKPAGIVTGEGDLPEADSASSPSEHAVLVGYGVAGRKVAEILDRLSVPYVVIDMNATAARALRGLGRNALYGDASREPVLARAGIEQARALVITVPDAGAARAIVALGRRMNRALRIIVRTRYALEVEGLEALGANEIVIEEHESALELAGRVLASYGAPESAIEIQKAAIRRTALGAAPRAVADGALRASLARLRPEEIAIMPGSRADGATLASLDLRRRTGATVLAVLRGRDLQGALTPDTVLEAGDVLIVVGEGRAIALARAAIEERLS